MKTLICTLFVLLFNCSKTEQVIEDTYELNYIFSEDITSIKVEYRDNFNNLLFMEIVNNKNTYKNTYKSDKVYQIIMTLSDEDLFSGTYTIKNLKNNKQIKESLYGNRDLFITNILYNIKN